MANLSIKGAREEVVEHLKQRALRNHRSLNGELLAILEAAVHGGRLLTPRDVLAAARASGLKTPREAAAIIRADRDGRSGR